MKKFVLITAAALVAAAFVSSCQKNTEAPINEPNVRTFTLTIAPTVDPETKLTIDAEGKTAWVEGDKIMIHGEYTNATHSDVITLKASDISADGKTATVTTTNAQAYVKSGYNSTLYVQYPATSVIADNHCYYNSRFNNTNQPLLVGYNNADAFVLYNICGVIAFQVSGDFDEYELVGKNSEVVGYTQLQSRIRLTSDNTENRDGFPIRATGDSFDSVPTTSVTAAVTSDGTTVNRIFIPGGVKFTSGFKLHFKKNGSYVKTLSTADLVEIAYGKLLNLGNVTSNLKDYSEPVDPGTDHYHTSAITVGSASALDGNGNANCYIVSAAGSYKFKAVVGNDATKPLNTIASVAVIWETVNSDTAPEAKAVINAVDYEYQSGNTPYMVFETPATLQAGNALLAAKNDLGDIIWSWHIWIPSTTVADIDAGFAGEKAIMDRNLGALVVTPTTGTTLASHGLFYQWGRKDPLGGEKIKGQPSMNKYVEVAAADMGASIKNPTIFYYTNGGDWLASGGSADLWDNSGAKTVYDPCPYGYKVPAYASTLNMWNKVDDATFPTVWTYDEANGYCKFNTATSVFPLCGYVNGTSQSQSGYGKRAVVWSSTESSSGAASCMFIRENKYKEASYNKSSAASVRCIKE